MISKSKKAKTIKEVGIHATDTGSSDVQIGLITKRIEELATHLKKHNKDKHSRRGLLGLVAQRQNHINYLLKTDPKRYNVVARKLELKKK